MSTKIYQILYVGPARYEGSAQEKQALRETVQSFITSQGGRRSGLVGVKVAFGRGFFTVYADSELSAYGMPSRFEEFERQYDALELSFERVVCAGPLFYQAEVW